MKRLIATVVVLAAIAPALPLFADRPAHQTQTPAPVTAIRAGRLLDPDTGSLRSNQIIVIQGNRIREVGAAAIPRAPRSSIFPT